MRLLYVTYTKGMTGTHAPLIAFLVHVHEGFTGGGKLASHVRNDLGVRKDRTPKTSNKTTIKKYGVRR